MEARFHSLTVPSSALEASVRPSREKATSQTTPLWPRKNLIFRPLGCQSPMVPSQLALAIHFPSGEKATPGISALCPSSMVGGPGRCVCQIVHLHSPDAEMADDHVAATVHRYCTGGVVAARRAVVAFFPEQRAV